MKIAIIGSGISGMSAAYLLNPHHDITLYESEASVGGHSRTVIVNAPEHGHNNVSVDTGFIVFNKKNYPLLTALFEHLDVKIAKSNMSFGVTIDQGRLEYGSRSLRHMFAQRENLFRLDYWRMLMDITRFNRLAPQYLNADLTVTLGDALSEMNLGEWFKDYYLLPMGASIWSTPMEKMLDYPVSSFTRFFMNHGLLTITDHPQWYTVQGGSKEYVKRLTATFNDHIKLNRGVIQVDRQSEGVKVIDRQGHNETFDQVIFACHADQALSLLALPTLDEQSILGQFHYQENKMLLHGDKSLMPKRDSAWSSWVYQSDQHMSSPRVSLSYWMNNLQPLTTKSPLIVTLNPEHEPNPDLVFDEKMFTHPIFNTSAVQAQSRIPDIQGVDRIWFCGAYQRYGFHEDGLWSAINVVEKILGSKPGWLK